MTRFWADGLPITVTQDDGAAPTSFAWRGQRHAVELVVERWRVDGGWWQRRAWREYFQCLTATGLLVLLYHDVRAGTWRLQRVYD